MTYAAEFTPISGLVFRDARPFEAGTDTVSSNLDFPPPPEAFWSALNRVLKGISPRTLRIRAFYLADKTGPLLPAMADLIRVSPADDPWATGTLSLLQPRQNSSEIGSGLKTVWLADRSVRSKPCEGELLRPDDFLLYLIGAANSLGARRLIESKLLMAEDRRTGVELRGRNVKEGQLYTAPVIFLNRADGVRVKAVFEVRDTLTQDFPQDHIVRLGGEGKLAHLKITPSTEAAFGVLPAAAQGNISTAIWNNSQGNPPFRVRLCLLTPAVFSARKELLRLPGTQTPAWRPFWMDNSEGGWCRPIFDGQRYRLRLVAAAAPKAFALGAWDRSEHIPRPLHRCQPAGTVYFLELEPAGGATAKEALDQFFQDFWLGTLLVKVKPANPSRAGVKRTSQSVSPHGLRGFGCTVIGAWNYA
jgi:CRISPR-associated protein Cmr3